MKVAFIGSRGIPANHGGFETFVEEVSVGLSKTYKYDVIVVGDVHQQQKEKNILSYKGVDILYSKYSKPNQTIRFYLDSMLKVWDADIIYSCGVGNAFFLFLPAIFKKKFITNPDGLGWKRLKWSDHGKKILKFMFYLSARLSPYIITDSVGIEKVFRDKFNRKKNINTIEYGAYINKTIEQESPKIKEVLESYDLISNQYHLVVSRLEPENNVDVIIKGYLKVYHRFPLIIIGNIMKTSFVEGLLKLANDKVIFIGGVYNKLALEIIRSNAFSYLHGHSVGGTNPSLLEAMASKNICICHHNEFNKDVVGDSGFYFKTTEDISNIITKIETNDFSNYKQEVFAKVTSYFNWENIIKLYANYFKKIAE
tara:strand:+ start:26874 stop:27977 length:1104 start_codon:yes stop_codon:yes gene_type:complete